LTLISLFQASKDYGINNLFKGLDLHINDKERLGLIGPNGSGKSTLLRVLAGVEPLLEGERNCSSSLNIKLVSQEPEIDINHSIIEEVLKGCGVKRKILLQFNEVSREIERNPGNEKLLKRLGNISEEMDRSKAWNLEQECQEILRRLGIKDLNKQVKELSGGYRKRVGLASALVSSPDILLLDEPTNHLDATAVEWLQGWLKNFQGALVLVTHDRYVLDKVTNKLVEINRGVIRKYSGNYESFLEKKVEEEKLEEKAKKKFKGALRRELDWLKQGPKARSTKQKARLQRIIEMQTKNNFTSKKILEIDSSKSRLGKKTIELENVQLTIDGKQNSLLLLENFSYSFNSLDRVGIIGKNGSGKSSLLDLLSGKRKPNKGIVEIGKTVKIGYLDQHTQELTDNKISSKKVIDFIEESATRVNLQGKERTASQLLERFLFPPQKQHSPLSKLSGGEKRRLSLCKILIQSPNVLLLDEPTNDLDIDTLSVLENFIEDFQGCVIVVSHDRYFLDRTIDRIFNFNSKKLERFEGNYTEFLEKKSRREKILKFHIKDKNINSDSKKNKSNTYEKNIQKRNKLSFKEKKELKYIEDRLLVLEENKSELEKELLENNGDISILSHKLANIISEINISEERWLDISDISS
tara:strand:+ start:13492 stop:15411 length:1920 start_codon:yes stop_codon:yes gene_type:complete